MTDFFEDNFSYKESSLWLANGVLIACENPDKDLVIPEGVTTIIEGAFRGKSLKSVTLPSTL